MISEKLNKIEKMWALADVEQCPDATNEDVKIFQKRNQVVLPVDLIEYFQKLNGTMEEYDEKFFQFYSLGEFKRVADLYKDWVGVPHYENLTNTLLDYNQYYAFADYSCNLFSYIIRLYPTETEFNEVLIVCGDKYQKIASSFSEFLDLYICDSLELQFK
jgi:hypothetical protein